MKADANIAGFFWCYTAQQLTDSRQSNATRLTRAPLQIQIKPSQPINGTFPATSLCNINKINPLLYTSFAVVPHSNILQSEDILCCSII